MHVTYTEQQPTFKHFLFGENTNTIAANEFFDNTYKTILLFHWG